MKQYTLNFTSVDVFYTFVSWLNRNIGHGKQHWRMRGNGIVNKIRSTESTCSRRHIPVVLIVHDDIPEDTLMFEILKLGL